MTVLPHTLTIAPRAPAAPPVSEARPAPGATRLPHYQEIADAIAAREADAKREAAFHATADDEPVEIAPTTSERLIAGLLWGVLLGGCAAMLAMLAVGVVWAVLLTVMP